LRRAQGRTSLWAPTDEPPVRLATAKPDNSPQSGGWQGKPKESKTGTLTGDVAGSLYVQPGALKQRRCGPFVSSSVHIWKPKEAALLPNVRRDFPTINGRPKTKAGLRCSHALARYASALFRLAAVHWWLTKPAKVGFAIILNPFAGD
jgi:hypothetical protein